MNKPDTGGLDRAAFLQAATVVATAAPIAAEVPPQPPPAAAVPALGGGQPTAQLFWAIYEPLCE